MHSPSRSTERALPLVHALALLGVLLSAGLLLLFPPLRLPHPQFGAAIWLLLAALAGFFPLSSGLLSTAARRVPPVTRPRRRRTAGPPPARPPELAPARLLRAGQRPGGRRTDVRIEPQRGRR